MLQIDTGLKMRGGQWQALRLMRGLRERGVQSVLLTVPGSELGQHAAEDRFSVHRAGPAAVLSAACDLVHAHDSHAHTLGLLARRPLIVARRVGFPVKENPVSYWKYRRARHFIAVSEHVRQMLLRAGVRPERISVTYDGVPLPGESPTQEERSRIVTLLSNDPGKGRRLIREGASRAGAPVFFSSDLEEDLQNAAIFLYISESEGLGSAALLAMAHGVPVIASRVGGLPEAVVHGKTGLLTENDPHRIGEAIRKLMADPALRERMGQNGRARVAERFTIDRMVEDTLQVYRRVVS